MTQSHTRNTPEPSGSPLASGEAAPFRLRDWVEAGAFFGHRRRARHPRMAPWIHATRAGVDMLDLSRLEGQLDAAQAAIAAALRSGSPILVVGDKASRQGPARLLAQALGAGFCLGRWPAGFLTNAPSHQSALSRAQAALEAGEAIPRRRAAKLGRVHAPSGAAGAPGLLIWLGGSEQPLVEAKARGWLALGALDSNSDPRRLDFPIVCNDDGSKALALLARALSLPGEAAQS